MESQLELSPHGVVICRDPDFAGLEGFEESEAAGLLGLGGGSVAAEADASVHFWKEIAESFIGALCHIPEGMEEALPPEVPGLGTLTEWVFNAPPMRGAEYLSPEVLTEIWHRIGAWTKEQVSECGSLGAFLETHAPRWSRVGRVTLHLAENKGDEEYPFAFMATYGTGLSKSGRLQQVPLGKALTEYAGAKNKAALLKLLYPIHTAAKESPLMADLEESGDIFHPLVWLPEEAYTFLQEVPKYEAAGLQVKLPNWWQKRSRRPQVKATIGETRRSSLGLNAMLDFNVEVVVDGEPLSREELDVLLEGDDGLVLLRGQWVEVDREKLQQALDHWKAIEAQGDISFAKGMRLLAGAPADLQADEELETERGWTFTEAGDWLSGKLAELREPGRQKPPKTLKATLRPYQETGLNWLWFCAQTGLGACLADDMGLGKTVQVLAALLRKKANKSASGPALLIVPASLIGNWMEEARKFAPSLKLFVAHRSVNEAKALNEPGAQRLAKTDLVITSYSMVTRLKWLSETDWSWVILDEAQAIKNHNTRQSRAVRKLNSEARMALTGTPIENRLGDLWSLFDFLNPGLLGNASQFSNFTKALRSANQDHYAPLRRLVSPYILRRLKTDKSIISDLPEKTEMKVYCGLSKSQAKLYQQNVNGLAKTLRESDGIQRRGLVLSYLMRFKQVCNHPDQLTGYGNYDSGESAKFQRLGDLCAEIESRGEKPLVFTQFREMTEPLAEYLESIFGRRGLVLHGGTPVKKRQKMIEEFQREDGPPYFILSLKAGGTGLNLTAASHVIHFDRWWNPAVENQATDRAFRIGQQRNVLVHKFVTTGTLEEKIDRLISEKTETAEQILSDGAEKMLTEMGDDELINMVSLDIRQAERTL